MCRSQEMGVRFFYRRDGTREQPERHRVLLIHKEPQLCFARPR